MSNPAPKRLAQKRPKSRSKGPVIAVVLIAALLALLAGGYFGFCSWVRSNGLLMPGTVVSDLPGGQIADLSKLDADSAAELLNHYLDSDLSSRSLTITYGDGQTALLEGNLLTADAAAPIASAMEAKNSLPFYQLGLIWLGLGGGGSQHTASALTFTEEGEARVERLAAQIAQELYIAPVDFTYEVTETTVELTLGADGHEVDQRALQEAITESLLSGQKTLEVTPTVVPSAELSGEILRELVYLAPQSSVMGADGKLTPTVIGHSVDADEAQAILDETEPGGACSIPLIFLQPDVEENSLLYQDLLASSTTYMAGTSNRRTNIKLAAQAVDGTVLLPGETFSYNETVGERTDAKGYKEATVYVAGQDKQELGGGICQLASALYYCSLYSNLEIVSRTPHRFAVTYVPYGLDATVAWGSIDYKFKNNTDYPIRISATTDSSNNLYVKFYGTKADDTYVEMKTTQLSSTPYSTVYQIDNSLAAGQTKELVHAYTGYKYESYRYVYDGDGNLISNRFEASSTYAYRDKVIGVSPADAAKYGLGGAAADPAPSASVQPSPDPAASTEPTPSTEPDPEVPPEETIPISEEPEPDIPAAPIDMGGLTFD